MTVENPERPQRSSVPLSITDELIDEIVSNSAINVNTSSNESKVSELQGNTLIRTIASRFGIRFDQALIATCIICQKGGTNRRANGDIYAIVDGIRITLQNIRDTMNTSNLRFTLRQWARTYPTQIFRIAAKSGVQGDLAKKIMRNNPNITLDDSIWLSNFQMDNPDCPEELRALMLDHFNSLFPNSNRS